MGVEGGGSTLLLRSPPPTPSTTASEGATPTPTPTTTTTLTATPTQTPTQTMTPTPTQSEGAPPPSPTTTTTLTATPTPTTTTTLTATPALTPTMTPTQTMTPTPSTTASLLPTNLGRVQGGTIRCTYDQNISPDPAFPGIDRAHAIFRNNGTWYKDENYPCPGSGRWIDALGFHPNHPASEYTWEITSTSGFANSYIRYRWYDIDDAQPPTIQLGDTGNMDTSPNPTGMNPPSFYLDRPQLGPSQGEGSVTLLITGPFNSDYFTITLTNIPIEG